MMHQMYINEPFSVPMGRNLFCCETLQILFGSKGRFEVHLVHRFIVAVVFAHSLVLLMYQMYLDVVCMLYGDFFAMAILAAAVMYFSFGGEVHGCSFGSSGSRGFPFFYFYYYGKECAL